MRVTHTQTLAEVPRDDDGLVESPRAQARTGERRGDEKIRRIVARDTLGEAKREPASHREIARVLEAMDHAIERIAIDECRNRGVERGLAPLAFAADSTARQWHCAMRACHPEARQCAIARGAHERTCRWSGA